MKKKLYLLGIGIFFLVSLMNVQMEGNSANVTFREIESMASYCENIPGQNWGCCTEDNRGMYYCARAEWQTPDCVACVNE